MAEKLCQLKKKGVGGGEGNSYTFPLTFNLVSAGVSSGPVGHGARITFPIIGSLLKDVKTITVTLYGSGIAGQPETNPKCQLLDSNGNIVKTLSAGNNDVSGYTSSEWDSITSLYLSGGSYSGTNQWLNIGKAIFKLT